MKHILLLTVLLNSFFNTILAQKKDSLNECLCYGVDTTDFYKLIKFGKKLNAFYPSYLDHSISLIENRDIVLFEKYYFFQKIDKQVKFDISKMIFDLEQKSKTYEDSIKLDELALLDAFLKSRIQLYANKVDRCKENELAKRYIQKKQLILQLMEHYFNEKISYDNSTFELAKIKYDKLIALEDNLIKKADLKCRIMLSEDSIRAKKDKNFNLYKEIIAESSEQKLAYQLALNQLKSMPPEKFHAVLQQDPTMYVVKKVLVNRDSTLFQIAKGVSEQIIILNNVMYVFHNDSLIKEVKNIGDNGVLTAFNAYKPIAVDQVPGTFYTIQIGTYSREKLLEELKISTNVFYKQLSDGKFRYSFGVYKHMSDVEKAMKLLKTIGYSHVVLIAYKEGEKITIEEAKKELK